MERLRASLNLDGEEVVATVIGLTDFAAFCDIGADNNAMLRFEELSDDSPELKIGDIVETKVKTIDRRKNKYGQVRLTCREVGKAFAAYDIGEEVNCKVDRIMRFGAFCEIGAEDHAFLPISEISADPDERIEDINSVIKVGETFVAQVQQFDLMRHSLKLTRRPLTGLRPDSFKAGQKVSGTVVSIAPPSFAFFDIGAYDNAVMHRADFARKAPANLADVLKLGDTIEATVKGLDIGGKIELTLLQ